jgi:hypothetical protein
MPDRVVDIEGVTVLVCAADGDVVRGESEAMDLLVQAMENGAAIVLIPAERLADDFFRLRTGVAGAVAQKFVNYRKRLAIAGDITRHVEASTALRDFVREANRGRDIWFLADENELSQRLARRPS